RVAVSAGVGGRGAGSSAEARVIVLTCGDLAMGEDCWDALARHDPEHQYADDTHCHCWHEPEWSDWFRSHEAPPDLPDHLVRQSCTRLVKLTVNADYVLHLCCLCASSFFDVTRTIPDAGLYQFLARQCLC